MGLRLPALGQAKTSRRDTSQQPLLVARRRRRPANNPTVSHSKLCANLMVASNYDDDDARASRLNQNCKLIHWLAADAAAAAASPKSVECLTAATFIGEPAQSREDSLFVCLIERTH